MDKLESAFGGNDHTGFDINKYAERMKEDDKRMPAFWTRGNLPSAATSEPVMEDAPSLDSIKLDADSDPSDKGKRNGSLSQGAGSEVVSVDHNMLAAASSRNPTEEGH